MRETNRAVVVHEAVRFGGLGAEIAAQIQEEAFDHLDAPVGRIGAPFSPVPFSPALEQHYVPDAARHRRRHPRDVARPALARVIAAAGAGRVDRSASSSTPSPARTSAGWSATPATIVGRDQGRHRPAGRRRRRIEGGATA